MMDTRYRITSDAGTEYVSAEEFERHLAAVDETVGFVRFEKEVPFGYSDLDTGMCTDGWMWQTVFQRLDNRDALLTEAEFLFLRFTCRLGAVMCLVGFLVGARTMKAKHNTGGTA
jgi:hypothetical protein